MRIATKTIYEMSRYQLSSAVEDQYQANLVVATGKRINSLSDDPVGVTQILDIKSNIASLVQLERNIETGKTWLTSADTTLSSINTSLKEAMVLCEQMITDTYSEDDRANAAEQVDEILKQVIQFANTQVNGQYIFAGTNTNTQPFELNAPDDPTTVDYYGNSQAFKVKTGTNEIMEVGFNGADVFGLSEITINDTNNMIDFVEYSSGIEGSELSAVITDGTYSYEELATAISNAMNIASDQSGIGINYSVDFDATTNQFAIQDDGTTSDVHVELLWESGMNAGTSIGTYIGFDRIDIRDALTSDIGVEEFPITINSGDDTIAFSEDDGSGPVSLSVTIPATTYNSGGDLASALELAMDLESVTNGYNIDYSVTYGNSSQQFVISKEIGTTLESFTLSGTSSSSGALAALGFSNTDHAFTPPTSDNEVNWSIFDTLIDLKTYLESNDTNGIAKSMTTLDTHFNDLLSFITETGSKINSLEIRENCISDLSLSFTERLTELEDADIIEASINLSSTQAAYEAALSAASKILSLNILDYM
ncbi:MAG: flagellar hook-associated protein FlgL [Desulfobacterales bacterium]|nr:flagellar hook-associated protein FlgL [Desulfobacterales bacterium]